MTLACARLGCTERAHTVLVFEPGSAAAWLMHAVEAHRTQGILLCRVHADVVTVPMGWNLVDERDPTWEPVVTSAAPAPAPEPEPTATAKAVPDPPLAEAEVVEIPVGSTEADEAAFEEVVAAQWTEDQEQDEVGTPTLFAVGEEEDEQSEAGSGADTPLLNRAFRAAHRI